LAAEFHGLRVAFGGQNLLTLTREQEAGRLSLSIPGQRHSFLAIPEQQSNRMSFPVPEYFGFLFQVGKKETTFQRQHPPDYGNNSKTAQKSPQVTSRRCIEAERNHLTE
jgi:hypothetical protein